MVTADDDGGRGDRRPSRRRWQLEVVLPSSALPPSRDGGGLRGAQKPVARRMNAVANAIAPAICTVAGAAASHGRETIFGGGDNVGDDTDGTDDAGVGNLPSPGGI